MQYFFRFKNGTCVASPTKPEKNFEHFSQKLLKPGFGESHPHTQGVAQCSHRSACVLCTEAPGRHSTQT